MKPWLDCLGPKLRRLYDIGKKVPLLDTIFERSLGTDYPITLNAIYVGDLEKELQDKKQKIDDLHTRWNEFIHARRQEMTFNPSFTPQLPEKIQLSLPDEIVDEIHSYVPLVYKEYKWRFPLLPSHESGVWNDFIHARLQEEKIQLTLPDEIVDEIHCYAPLVYKKDKWRFPLLPSHEAELCTLRIKWWQENNGTLCIPRCVDNCITSRDCICEKWAGLVLTQDGGTAINKSVRRPASTKFPKCGACGTLYYRREITCALDSLPGSWKRCKKNGCY